MTRKKDLEHLNLLAIFHFVYAGLTALVATFPLLHVFFGASMLLMPVPESQNGPPLALMGGMFVVIGATIFALGWLKAAAILYAGLCLKQIKRRTFCLVMAAICCAFTPLGTLLGVFTLVKLLNDDVKELFEAREPLGDL